MPRSTCLLMAILPAFCAFPALAQETPYELPPIFVSVHHWDELASQAATSATVLTPQDRDGTPKRDLQAITDRSANVVFQRANSGERLVVRGISAFDNALADPVGYRVNGVSLPLGTLQLPHFFAADQVTLLKGPQGTTIGRNSEAGLLSYDTLAPGSLDGWQAEIGVNGSDAGASPLGANGSLLYSGWLNDDVALTFGAEMAGDQGVITDPATGVDDGGKSERLTAVFGVQWALENGASLRLTSVAEHEDLNKEQFRYVSGPQATGRFQSSYSDPSSETRDMSVTALEYSQSFDGFDLTAITGFTTFNRDFTLDFDSSRLPLGVTTLDLEDRMLSQEIRLTSPEGAGPLKWSAGVHVYRQKTDVAFNLGALSTDRQTEITQSGIGLYGFGEYAVNDRLRLGAGVRLDWTESDATQQLTTMAGSSRYEGSQSDLTVLPKLTAAYDVTPDTTLYGTLARGYLPGGYNYAFASDAGSLTYDPEYSWSFETGVKKDFASGAALRLAGFYTRIDDKQIAETIPGAAQRISNAAEAETYGIEAEASAPLGQGWSVRATAGWQKARATSFETTVFDPGTGGLRPVDYSGNALPLAPETTYGLALSYDGRNGWSGEIALNGSGNYYFDPGNTIEQDGYHAVDVSVSRQFDKGKLTVWATNLFDEEYYASAANTVRGTVVEDGAARRFGVNYRMEW
ncbi:TonB-dependent receptor [Salipiger mucosus]|uniref:TonB-dependent receptor n=1 Tax=Salipiger mucosus DSM 16094 TaxID=1123237 RepID=S9S1M3_9RHOB|nr:TonB-dependent receptor [Salipiger mucosus]EPX84095.1 TonB-dependent receptor [Salipiger mucosus DSM 16094]